MKFSGYETTDQGELRTSAPGSVGDCFSPGIVLIDHVQTFLADIHEAHERGELFVVEPGQQMAGAGGRIFLEFFGGKGGPNILVQQRDEAYAEAGRAREEFRAAAGMIESLRKELAAVADAKEKAERDAHDQADRRCRAEAELVRERARNGHAGYEEALRQRELCVDEMLTRIEKLTAERDAAHLSRDAARSLLDAWGKERAEQQSAFTESFLRLVMAPPAPRMPENLRFAVIPPTRLTFMQWLRSRWS